MSRCRSRSPESSANPRSRPAWSRSRPTAGIVGHGLAAITRETVIAEIVNGVIAPAIKGDDPLAHERVWDKLYWTLMPRGQTGFARAGAVGRRHRAVGHQGQGVRAAGVAAPRRRALARAALRHLRFPFLRARTARRRGEAMGVAGLPAAQDGGRPRGAASTRDPTARGRSSGRTRRACVRCAKQSGRTSSSTSTPIAASTSITPPAWPSW